MRVRTPGRGLMRFGSVVQSVLKEYLADILAWSGSSMLFGDTTLEQSSATYQPTLVGDHLVFDSDYVASRDPDLLATLNSLEFELSFIFRPRVVAAYCIVSIGKESVPAQGGNPAVTGTNNENVVQITLISGGKLRVIIDGNAGVGAQSFTTNTNVEPGLVAGEDCLVTLLVTGGYLWLTVRGVPLLDGLAITGPLPVGMNVFAVGGRHMVGITQLCDGAFKMLEIRGV
jgi:hypothetical protein